MHIEPQRTTLPIQVFTGRVTSTEGLRLNQPLPIGFTDSQIGRTNRRIPIRTNYIPGEHDPKEGTPGYERNYYDDSLLPSSDESQNPPTENNEQPEKHAQRRLTEPAADPDENIDAEGNKILDSPSIISIGDPDQVDSPMSYEQIVHDDDDDSYEVPTVDLEE